MGSGKTTLGKKISKITNNCYYDLDDFIVYHHKISIKRMYLQKNEKYFRDIESSLLKQILFKENKYILSVGGGTPCYKDNMYLMNQYAITIYLQVSFKHLLTRLHNDKKYRPIICNLDSKYLKSFIFKHLSNRKIFYEHVKYKINIFTTIF